jgi:signal transduction histidine kinase
MAGLLNRHGGELRRLAEEQATFRRLATLVARGAPAAELFVAFADEIGRLLPGDQIAIGRYEPDGTVVAVAAWTRTGGRVLADEHGILARTKLCPVVFESGRAAQVEPGADPDVPGSCVAAPIRVEGRLWGVMVASSDRQAPLPAGAEARLGEFAELIATVIANAESRAELKASRARIVAASDEARRRIERDLHDGAQQRLVSLALELRSAQASVPAELGELRAELSRVVEGLTAMVDELREIARGIHPAILDAGGLAPALKMLARRSPTPVELQVRTQERLPDQTEVAAYYVVSETLANVAKHARASLVRVEVEAREGMLRVCVRDDGVGGADPARGSGLAGLTDRVEALGGSISIQSPTGRGTSVEVELPLGEPAVGSSA